MLMAIKTLCQEVIVSYFLEFLRKMLELDFEPRLQEGTSRNEAAMFAIRIRRLVSITMLSSLLLGSFNMVRILPGIVSLKSY
jgi:hypothetical protein